MDGLPQQTALWLTHSSQVRLPVALIVSKHTAHLMNGETSIVNKIDSIRHQVYQRYNSVEGILVASEHAIAELYRMLEESPDPEISHLLAETQERRAILLEKTLGLATARAIGDWEYALSRLQWLVVNGYEKVLDDSTGENRSTLDILEETRTRAREWSREKAPIYMRRARDLLPIAPIAAINYLDKARKFPELPRDIALDIDDLHAAASELLDTQHQQTATPIRFSALIQLLNRKVETLTEEQAATQDHLQQLRTDVLGHIAGIELQIAQVVSTLNQGNLESLRLVVRALDEGKVARAECIAILEVIHRIMKGLQGKNTPAPEVICAVDKYISDVQLEAGHKLKVTIPIVPFLLEYEGELQLVLS
jgi:hypothetical protein